MMPGWDFDTGAVPMAQADDIRTALAVIIPIRRSNIKGIVGSRDPQWLDLLTSGRNMAGICTRATFVLIATEGGLLDKWREGDSFEDVVFQVAATFPLTIKENREMDFDFEGFVKALEAP